MAAVDVFNTDRKHRCCFLNKRLFYEGAGLKNIFYAIRDGMLYTRRRGFDERLKKKGF